MCEITSNMQTETREFYNMIRSSIIDSTKIYNKNKVTLYCTKCDPGFACQDEYKLNPDKLPPLVVNYGYLYIEEEI